MRILDRSNLPNLYFLVLPLVAVGLGWGVAPTLLALAAGLVWKWFGPISRLLASGGPGAPELRLETISASPFVEKVRWSLDRLGLPYREEPVAGVLGIFLMGRTVPRLHFRTGVVTSTVGNSSDILRYLWGRYAAELGDRAAFLAPTPERLALEARFDAYGADLQRYFYTAALPHRDFTLHFWGRDDPRLPAWQRAALTLLYPVLCRFMTRGLQLGPEAAQASGAAIEKLLGEIEERLSDGRRTLLGGPVDFADLTFAAMTGAWLVPKGYGAGEADAVTIAPERWPPDLARETRPWRENFPRVVAFVERLYAEERLVRTDATPSA